MLEFLVDQELFYRVELILTLHTISSIAKAGLMPFQGCGTHRKQQDREFT